MGQLSTTVTMKSTGIDQNVYSVFMLTLTCLVLCKNFHTVLSLKLGGIKLYTFIIKPIKTHIFIKNYSNMF